MERQAFLTLTTSSQWLLFLAIGLIIFSWVEKKILYQQLGQAAFVLLGAFAVWVLASHQIVVPEVPKGADPPAEAIAITYFTALISTGVFGVVAFVMATLKKIIWAKYINMILIVIGVSLFFMVYRLQQL
ncbi:MAG TPA: hypothetical protein VKA27_06405 [Sunxiuqinia sp.]|nr:hypothetical protein [Sunxiuqinia sp.]